MKKSDDNSRYSRFEGAVRNLQLMRETGAIHSPAVNRLWQLGLSPLNHGKHAVKYQAILSNILIGPALMKHFAPVRQPARPAVPKRYAIVLGYEKSTGRPLIIHRDLLTHHMLVVGATGSGKTHYVNWIASQIIGQNINPTASTPHIVFVDRKGEGRRYINRYRNVAIFRPDQLPWNILEPKGNHHIYWSAIFQEIAKAFNLRPETWSELSGIMLRIEKGMKPGDPYPSLVDFERILRTIAEKENRSNLTTAARAIASLNSVLGRTAFIRKVIKDEPATHSI